MSTTISTRAELLALLDAEGRLSRPVTLAPGCRLDDLSALTSLAGLTMSEGCWLYDLTSVTTLDGLTLAERCWLTCLSPAMRAELAKLREMAP